MVAVMTPIERACDLAMRIDNHKLYSVQSRTGRLPSMEDVETEFARMFATERRA